jgi:hypothetical protein
MPPLEAETYLIQLWEEAGTIESNGMGITRLSWKEIEAWLAVRERKGELPLKAWEIDMVRMLSTEYVAEYQAASEVNAPAPYDGVTVEDLDRPAIANKMKSLLGAFKKKPDHSEE